MCVTIVQLSRNYLAGAVLLACNLGGVQTLQSATPPRATIDVGLVVECRDVTAPEFAVAHPQQKVVEATFRLSVLSQSIAEADLEQLQVTIASLAQRLRVVDFQPRTEVASDLAGDVEVCSSDETVQSLNASLGGVVSGDHGPVHAQASPAAGVGITKNRGSKESFHRLSPKQLVLASGTMNAEHAVFFKWRRSSQATLEGSREMTCRFLVPHNWRGDWVQLQADLVARHHNYFGERLEPCGRTSAIVALHLSGDAEAQQAATNLAAAQLSPTATPGTTARHTAYKPVSSPARSGFTLPSFLTGCDRSRPADSNQATATDAPARRELVTALRELEQFSGQAGGE